MSVPPNEFTTAPPPPAGTPNIQDRQWAMFAHLAALSGCFTVIGAIVGPLIVWQMKRNESTFVDDQGKEATNFNITMFILGAALVAFGIVTFGLGFILVIPVLYLLGIAWLVFTIIATVKANEGVAYRYPFAIRLFK